MTSHPAVRLSASPARREVGKLLMQQAASTVKKVGLELGGNAPFIVFDDADIDAAVQGAIAVEIPQHGPDLRLHQPPLVQDGVHDEFAASFAGEVAKMKVGNGIEVGVVQGPLINMNARSRRSRSTSPMPSPRAPRSSSAASATRWAAPSSSRPCFRASPP
jgi:succinate-semialdehyde dehydrogenase/glutarate-semialdehyde dehydrogenase